MRPFVIHSSIVLNKRPGVKTATVLGQAPQSSPDMLRLALMGMTP